MSPKQRPAVVSVAIAGAILLAVTLIQPALAQAPSMPPPAKGQTAGQYFKNVTTASLKGLTPSDFLGAMGVMTAAVGYDCSNCHPGAGTDAIDWVTDRNPKKVTARKMVDVVAAINKNFFGGAQVVTCWTCHRGQDNPPTSIALDRLYGEPNEERRDILPPDPNEPAAAQILDQYVEAAGGAAKLATLKSYVATGTSRGYAGMGGTAVFELYAQAPDSRGMWIHFPQYPDRGVSAWTYDGKTGWIVQPRAIVPVYELTGNDLAGAKLDALVAFPSGIKTAFANWRVVQGDTINGREMYVVQGIGQGAGVVGTFYFDKQTHLLTRFVRRTPSPVGRISIQQDFDNYKDVGGIKLPFKYSFLWLDGRFTAEITDVKINVPIDAAKFTRPQ